MSIQKYSLYLNINMAVFDIIGRILGGYQFGKGLTYVSLYLVIFFNFFLIYQYLTNMFIRDEGVCLLLIVLVSLYVFIGGVATSYFMPTGCKKATPQTQDAIGSLMVNSLLSGIASGNIISILIAKIKKGYFEYTGI